MIVYIAPLILLAITVGWICLPLVPTLKELQRRTDVRPLSVERQNDGEVRSFARSFKAFLESSLQLPVLRERLDAGVTMEGVLQDGTPYRLVGGSDEAIPQPWKDSASVPAILLLSTPAVLPDSLMFLRGIYAAQDVDCGQKAVIRSVFGERDVRLRHGTVISRWIHAENNLNIAGDCEMYGRATAEGTMFVGPRVVFERLHAGRVLFGRAPAPVPPRQEVSTLAAGQIQAREMAAGTYVVDHDLNIPAQRLITGNYVARGTVTLGHDSQVDGSIRSHGDMRIGAGVVVTGSVISSGDLEIGPNCQIRGPVIASRQLTIHSGCQIGIAGHPTSAVAPTILVHLGVLILGTVWAREQGQVGE